MLCYIVSKMKSVLSLGILSLRKKGRTGGQNYPPVLEITQRVAKKRPLKIVGLKDSLGYVDFGMLATIMVEKWEYFESIIPSQHWLMQRMEELEKARNFIAHNRMLLPSEFQRMYMYIADWNRVIGL